MIQKVSRNCIDLLIYYNQFNVAPVMINGVPIIGYGHRISPNDARYTNDITIEQALTLLKEDVTPIEEFVTDINTALTQGQFDALVSLIHHWGIDNFKRSIAYKHLCQGKLKSVARELFNEKDGVIRDTTGKTSSSIIMRRARELKLWNNE